MTEEVKADKIKKTQESLSKFIKKPPLTDKLLRKPPFRFLHDIVTAVMRETGFLNGVYSPEELDSENIKDREGKIGFLDKLISNIKAATGSSVAAKPSKIIAGLEVNKTLDLLIALANAVDIKLNGAKGNDNSSSSRGNLGKDQKKTSRGGKDDKSDPTKKKRDDSRGRTDREAKKKAEAKTKVADKKRATERPDANKKEKANKDDGNAENQPPTVSNTDLKDSAVGPKQNGSQGELTDNEGMVVKTQESVEEKVAPPVDRPPSLKQPDPSHSAKDRKPSERRRSSRQSSYDTSSSESKVLLERSVSVAKDDSQSDALTKPDDTPHKEKRPESLDKIPLELVVQVSSDSVTASNLSSEPSDKVNGNISPEINGGDLSSLEASERTEKRTRVSSVDRRTERHLSAGRPPPTPAPPPPPVPADSSQPADRGDHDHHAQAPRTAKMKRPQSAKMRPPSSRQRKGEKEKEKEDGGGGGSQVVLGEGESVDVMGAAPVSAPSAKGRRMLSGRPMSARPGAPKPKDRGQVNPSDAPSGGEEVKPIALIEDNKDEDNDDDAENLVTVQKQAVDTDDHPGAVEEALDLNLDESNQGALVAQILETKKELEDTKKSQWQSPYQQRTNVEIDWEARCRSRRDALAKEVKNLRDGIQTVTRSSNPLGKLFDFLQEDVELMQSELQEWTDTNARLQNSIQLQSKHTEELLSPLRKQLADLDSLVEHQQESIRRVKSNIHLNTVKLDNLLKIDSA